MMPRLYLLLFVLYFGISIAASFSITSGFHMKVDCRAITEKKEIALTFDDGPDPVATPRVLDVLNENNLKATFFLIGKKIPGNEPLLRRILDEGHIIGTHSYSHSNWFDLFTPRVMRKEFLKTNELISEATGKIPRLFRPPYGVINPMVKAALKKTNLTVIGFSNRSYDTTTGNTGKIAGRFASNLKPGDIAVLHDTNPRMPEIIKAIAGIINERGYKVRPLDQLLNIQPYEN